MEKGIRKQVQTRSKERLGYIVKNAKKLIGEKGIESVSMREIALTSKIQIGSLYQYFPNKTSLILYIMSGYYDTMYDKTRKILDKVESLEDLEFASEKAFKQFRKYFVTDNSLSNLWAGARAIPELVAEDNAVTLRYADLIVKTTLRVVPNIKETEVKPFALYYCHSIATVLRLTTALDRTTGSAVIRESLEIIRFKLGVFRQISENRSSND
ncbi:TetR/AcrR family transcriptional regulator [Leptospira sp. 96542]|nr:TetR/AcrR family transcriptional regulator [Leptospira sp. 96542]